MFQKCHQKGDFKIYLQILAESISFADCKTLDRDKTRVVVRLFLGLFLLVDNLKLSTLVLIGRLQLVEVCGETPNQIVVAGLVPIIHIDS